MKGIDMFLVSFLAVSTCFLVIVFGVYLRFRLSIKYPNNMFFIVITLQIIGDISIIILSILLDELPPFYTIRGRAFQRFLLYLVKFVKCMCFHFVFAIIVEIYIKIKKKLVMKHQTRMIIYTVYSTTICTLITIFENPLGEGLVNTGEISNIICQIYILLACAIQLIIELYLYIFHCKEVRSKDMIVLVALSVLGILISTLQSVMIMIVDSKTSNTITYVSYAFVSILGLFEFWILFLNPKFRSYIMMTILCKNSDNHSSFKSEEINISLMNKSIEDFKLTFASPGLFSDLFEGITTNTLVTIFLSITMRYLKTQGRVQGRHKIFEFSKSELDMYQQKTQLNFLNSAKTLTVYDTEFETFEKIQAKYLKSSISESIANPSNFEKLINLTVETGGRSNSFIFVTTDRKFVIKTITKHEYSIFRKNLLQNYSQRVLGCDSSKIVRIFALLNLKSLKQYVIIMENLIHDKENSYIFDLKGSKVGRNVKDVEDHLNPPKGLTLKDVNFEQFAYKVPLHPKNKTEFMQLLKDDFLVLKDCGIMDYSILICIRKESKLEQEDSRLAFVDLAGSVVTLGIIDIFQEYNFSKCSETTFKTIFNKKNEVSSIKPIDYYYRIKEYLNQIII